MSFKDKLFKKSSTVIPYTAKVKIVGNGQIEVDPADIFHSQKFWDDMEKLKKIVITPKK